MSKMKHAILIINMLLWFVLAASGQNDTIIKSGYVNLATLVLDFQTYQFEGGHMAYYQCPDCATDSMQYFVDYLPAGDFGGISFTLNQEQDTFFDATIVWAGMGGINYPTNYSLSAPFIYESNAVPEPGNIKYLGINGEKIDEGDWLFELKDEVWPAVDSLSITNLFAEEDYKAVVYFYPPSVGVLDPSVAKWIVFLYFSDRTNSIKPQPIHSKAEVFPNPASEKITLSGVLELSQGTAYEIYTLTGQVLRHGYLDASERTIDISAIPQGCYSLILVDLNGKLISRNLFFKE